MKNIVRPLVALLALASMSACTVVDHTIAKSNGEKHAETVNTRFEQAQRPAVAPRVIDSDGIWVNKRATSMQQADQLPPMFRQAFQFGQETRGTLRDALNRVVTLTGVRVNVAPDAKTEVENFVVPAGFRFEGDLQAFLDQQTTLANVSWQYRSGAIDVFRFETKVFHVAATLGTTDFSTNMSNRSGSSGQASSGGTGGTSGNANSQLSTGQDVKHSAKIDFWSGLRNDLKNLLTRDGKDASYTVSEATRTVTVTATPAVLAAIESYVKDVNASRTRQVWLDVRAYLISESKGRDFGMAWKAAYAKAGSDSGATLVTPAATSGSLGLLTAILGPSSTSRFANTELMLNALSTLGNASVAAEAMGMVPSGEPLLASKMREVTYLARTQSTIVPNAGSQVSNEPGVTSEGFTLTVIPTTIAGDTIMIKGQLDISTIDKIGTDGTAGNTISTPQRSINSMPMNVVLKSGQTYIYGMRQVMTSVADSGVSGTAFVDLLTGGQRSSKEDRKSIVITVTPHIINTAMQ